MIDASAKPGTRGTTVAHAAHTQRKRQNQCRSDEEIFAEETKGIDARFYVGIPDISKHPSACKSAASVRAQIAHFGPADIDDEVQPTAA